MRKLKEFFNKMLFVACTRSYDRLPFRQQREVVKHITGPMREGRNVLKELSNTKHDLRVKHREQEVERLKEMFVFSRHAKIRLSERFGRLSTRDILADIRKNYQSIIVCKDQSFQLVTTNNTYVFTKDYLLVTLYKGKPNVKPTQD